MSALAGPVALVGSVEYLPVLDGVERASLSGRASRFVQLATAAAPEGTAARRAHPPLRGNPKYLVEVLRDSPVWTAIVAVWQGGAALAGCSAGAMALSAGLPDIRRPWRPALPALGLVPMVEMVPHFDAFASRIPDMVLRRVAGRPSGVRVIGVDDGTALVGGLDGWRGSDGWDGAPAGP